MNAWINLSPRGKWALRGGDRERFLNGQITNQVKGLDDQITRYTCITNRKGQVEGDAYLTAWPEQEELLLDVELPLRDALFERLDRYLIADDVELIDRTDTVGLIHVLGSGAPIDVGGLLGARRSNRYGIAGIDLFMHADAVGAIVASLEENDLHAVPEATLEYQRIAAGIPLWGRELTMGLLPPEARLEDRAIDYHKGCYIGQEVISRMRHAGKVNRLLCVLECKAPVEAGLVLTDSEEAGAAKVGTITSAIADPHSDSDFLALAFVKAQHAAPGSTLYARTTEKAACVDLRVRQFPDFASL